MNFDAAINDLKDELLLTDPEGTLKTVAFAYKLDVDELRAHALPEIGDLSTYKERVAAAKADTDRLKAIAEQVESEASVLGRLASLFPKAQS